MTQRLTWEESRDKEHEALRRLAKKLRYCQYCKHFGKPIEQTLHQGKQRCTVHECEIHPGCMNTEYSLSCEDWEH